MDLNSLLTNSSSNKNSSGQDGLFLSIINSSISDGSFILHYLLSNQLKQQQQKATGERAKVKILFISFAQTFSHYRSIQAKFGNSASLNEAIENGSFLFVDMMLTDTDENSTTTDPNSDFLSNALKKVTTFFNNDSKQKHKQQQQHIFVDDLSVPLLCGVATQRSIFEFIRIIQRLQTHQGSKHQSTMTLFAQMLDSCVELPLLVDDLCFCADRVFKVEKLTTGYLKDINGKIEIRNHSVVEDAATNVGDEQRRQYLYKISDKNVVCQPI